MAAVTMLFGSIPTTFGMSKASPKPACGTTRSSSLPANLVAHQVVAHITVPLYDFNAKKCFEDLEEACAKRVSLMPEGRVVSTKKAYVWKEYSAQQLRNKKRRQAAVERAFAKGSSNTKEMHVDSAPPCLNPGTTESFKSPYWRRSVKTQKKVVKRRIVKLDDNQLSNLIKTVMKACKQADKPIYVFERNKRPNVFTHPLVMGRKHCRIHLQHFENKLKRTDLHLSNFARQYVLPHACIQFHELRRLKFRPGDCGLIVDAASMPLLTSEYDDKFFILRGKFLEQYIDARETLESWELELLEQY
nr:P1 [Platycodon mild mottle virus]